MCILSAAARFSGCRTVSGRIAVLGHQAPQAVCLNEIFLRRSGNVVFSLYLVGKGAEFSGHLAVKCRAAGGIVHPVGLRQHPQFVKEAVFCIVDPVLESFLSLRLDKFVRILVGAKVDHRRFQSAASQDSDITKCRAHAGAVAVVCKKDSLRIAPEQGCLAGRKGRPQGGDRLIEACLVHGNDIHVSLTEDQMIRLGPPRQIQRVQVAAFVKDHGVRGVDIFGLCVPQDPASEADHSSPHVLDGKHDSVKKTVVQALLLIEDGHIGL